MHSLALAVAKDLDFDMARRGEVFFDIHICIAKRGLAFGARGQKSAFHFVGVLRHFHTATASSGGGFDDHRIAHLCADVFGILKRWYAPIRSGHAGHAQLFHRFFGRYFIAHDADMFGCGANKGQTVIFYDLHKTGIFRQETIAGMNRLRTGYSCRGRAAE